MDKPGADKPEMERPVNKQDILYLLERIEFSSTACAPFAGAAPTSPTKTRPAWCRPSGSGSTNMGCRFNLKNN